MKWSAATRCQTKDKLFNSKHGALRFSAWTGTGNRPAFCPVCGAGDEGARDRDGEEEKEKQQQQQQSRARGLEGEKEGKRHDDGGGRQGPGGNGGPRVPGRVRSKDDREKQMCDKTDGTRHGAREGHGRRLHGAALGCLANEQDRGKPARAPTRGANTMKTAGDGQDGAEARLHLDPAASRMDRDRPPRSETTAEAGRVVVEQDAFGVSQAQNPPAAARTPGPGHVSVQNEKLGWVFGALRCRLVLRQPQDRSSVPGEDRSLQRRFYRALRGCHMTRTMMHQKPSHMTRTMMHQEPSHMTRTMMHQKPSHMTRTMMHQEPSHVTRTMMHQKPSHTTRTTMHQKPSHMTRTTMHQKPSHMTRTMMQQKPSHMTRTMMQQKPSHMTRTMMHQKPSHMTRTMMHQKPSHMTRTMMHQKPSHMTRTMMHQKPSHMTRTMMHQKPSHMTRTMMHQKPSHVTRTMMHQEPSHMTRTMMHQEPSHMTRTMMHQEPSHMTRTMMHQKPSHMTRTMMHQEVQLWDWRHFKLRRRRSQSN
ncbi:hypothetical protein WMY93_026345 [Mugilogobius chulae]|uniref:Uncharacterized protein n=1 Tax=Mugilogobius chulae TaxID=88201 RepID=A0AAW0MY77_9GOBI